MSLLSLSQSITNSKQRKETPTNIQCLVWIPQKWSHQHCTCIRDKSSLAHFFWNLHWISSLNDSATTTDAVSGVVLWTKAPSLDKNSLVFCHTSLPMSSPARLIYAQISWIQTENYLWDGYNGRSHPKEASVRIGHVANQSTCKQNLIMPNGFGILSHQCMILGCARYWWYMVNLSSYWWCTTKSLQGLFFSLSDNSCTMLLGDDWESSSFHHFFLNHSTAFWSFCWQPCSTMRVHCQ